MVRLDVADEATKELYIDIALVRKHLIARGITRKKKEQQLMEEDWHENTALVNGVDMNH